MADQYSLNLPYMSWQLKLFYFIYVCSSQLSQSQVQVKLEPSEDGPITALNGDSHSEEGQYHSLMNGNSLMETGTSEDEVREGI